MQKVLHDIKPTLPSKIKLELIHGVFNDHMTRVLEFLREQKQRIAPTLAFVDPFGFSHTPFPTIGKIMQNPKCEVIVNFMYEEMKRFLSVDH